MVVSLSRVVSFIAPGLCVFEGITTLTQMRGRGDVGENPTAASIYMGVWSDEDTPALQAVSCGCESHHLHHFRPGRITAVRLPFKELMRLAMVVRNPFKTRVCVKHIVRIPPRLPFQTSISAEKQIGVIKIDDFESFSNKNPNAYFCLFDL